jgi:hypothetical protein
MNREIGSIDYHWEACLSCASADSEGNCLASDSRWRCNLSIDTFDEAIYCGCYEEKED